MIKICIHFKQQQNRHRLIIITTIVKNERNREVKCINNLLRVSRVANGAFCQMFRITSALPSNGNNDGVKAIHQYTFYRTKRIPFFYNKSLSYITVVLKLTKIDICNNKKNYFQQNIHYENIILYISFLCYLHHFKELLLHILLCNYSIISDIPDFMIRKEVRV